MHLLKQYAKRLNKGKILLLRNHTCVIHNLLFLLDK